MPQLLLLLVVGLPFAMAAAPVLARRGRLSLVRLSIYASLALAAVVSLAVVDVEIPLLAGRALVLTPVAQLGVQLLALAMLGLTMSLADAPPAEADHWLPLAWLSLGGMTLALLVTSLTLAVLAFVAAALVWVLSPPASAVAPGEATGPVPLLRFGALLALTAPLLLVALRLAELRTGATPGLERLALALALPGFGLVLSIVPLHTWTVTLAVGSPRPMVLGVIGLVQTTAFVLLWRTFASYPWMVQQGRLPLILGGALSAVVGGWLALSARRDDPDLLAYTVIANSGFLVAGLGTQSQAAAQGVTLLLFARVLALVVMALAPRAGPLLERAAFTVGSLALAGTPGLAGFPGLWLILRALWQVAPPPASLGVVAGSGLLFAATVRHVSGEECPPVLRPGVRELASGQGPIVALILLLVLLGLAPQLVAPAFHDALRGLFLPMP